MKLARRVSLIAGFALATATTYVLWPSAQSERRSTAHHAAGNPAISQPGAEGASASNKAETNSPTQPNPAGPAATASTISEPSYKPEVLPPPDFTKITAFDHWLQRWNNAKPEDRPALREEGVRLARERRPDFKSLIATDPRRALEEAVPPIARQKLPPEIVHHLEKPVSAKGDYNVYLGQPAPGQPKPAEGLALRYFEANDVSYKARVFGEMEQVLTKKDIPLRGVAVDREFAVAENPVRQLEVGEVIPPAATVTQVCPISGNTTTSPAPGAAVTDSTPTVEVGGQLITLCNGSHVHVLEENYRTLIQASGPGGAGFFYEGYPGNSSSAIGNFRTLYIRVTYPDQMAQPNTEEQAYADMANNRRYYLESSYGKMTQTTTVTPLLVLPHTLQWYYAKDGEVDCLGLIHNDSRAIAKAAGYDPSQFTCIIVRINKGPRLEGVSWGGGSSVWITWNGMGVLNHECGHSLGRNHANYWNTSDGTPYGTGANQEYGNDFDVMGGGGDSFAAHYNTISKRALGWLPDAYVHLPKSNGVYRIYAYDQPRLEEGKRYALSVAKDSIRAYNLEYHPAYSQHQNSALVLYSGMGSNAGHLLDTTPGSPDGKNDAGIIVGRTYSDLEADMHFTVLSKNNTVPPSIDVAYNRGPFPGNVAPTLTLVADATTIAVGGTVNFTATANDANGDPLAYQWEFSDGVDGLSNSATFSRTFTAAAQITAMVTVSDMKGGTARGSVVINVGAHGKQTITGTVTAGAQPLAGVYLTGGGSYCYSNADGTYSLAGVTTGSQTLTATLNGYTLTPSFTNPLTVVAGTNTANWIAAGSTFVTLTKVADAAEGGANGTFRLTRTGDTSADLVVLVSPAGGTATKTTDYTFTPDYAASGSFKSFTIPAGSATLDITVAAVNDTAAEGPETITLQLASATGYLSGSANAAVMTITDNDTTLPQVGVTAPDPYATEAPGDTGTFTFTRTGATTAALNLTVAWSGAATNGTDYTTLPTTVTIPSGQSSVNVVVSPINDTAIEPPEDVVATISTNAAYVRDPGATTATVTITDDDTPVVTVSAPDAVASEAGPDAGVFLISRTGSTAAPLKVYYGLSGSALHGTDYAPLPGEVTIPAGATSAPVVITPYDDDIGEPAETVTLALATFNDAYSLGTNFQATLTILDNSDVPLVNVRSGAVGTEGGTNPTLIFHAIGSGSGNVTVNYTIGGTATPGSDYTALSGTVTLPVNGSNDVTVTIPLINDTTPEPTETVTATITPSAAYRVYNDATATAFVLDNDSGDRVMVSTYNQSPSESGPTSGTFYLSRTGTTGDLTVNYTLSGTATNGVDYQTLSGTVVIPDTQSGVNLTMTPTDDALAEGTETVTLTVQPGTGYGVDWPASATFEIADNDAPTLTVGFQQAALATSEQPGPLGEYRDLPVVLSAASANTVTVSYTAGGGSAAGDDTDWAFVDAANGNAIIPGGTLTFAPGVTTQNIRIRVKNDGVTEGMETAVILLRAPFNASLTQGRTQEVVAIFDGAVPSTLVTEERWNNTAVYTNQTWSASNPDYTGYLLSFTPSQDVADNYSRRLVGQIVAPATGTYNFWIASDDASRLYLSTDSTAANKAQIATLATYTSFQNWDANASQKSANITLTAGQSYYMEVQHQEGGGGDHVSVAWQGPGFTRTPITFTTTDPSPRTVRMLSAATTRSETDGSEPLLMAVLDRPAGSTPITVNYSSSGTATNGSDYQLTAGTLTFNSGEQFKAIPLTILTDAIGEAPESIVVTLSSPSGAQLATPSAHTITLIDAFAPVVDTVYATAASTQSAGTLIATATATPASSRTITGWAILGGNPGNAFAINASGQVTLATPSLLPSASAVQLIVRATDNAGATGDGAVNVICNAPAQSVVEQRWNDENVFWNESWSTSTPSFTGTLASFTSTTNVADHFSRRLTGFIKPTTSGAYTFWVAGDDDCRLYLSTDGNPANKTQIAFVSGWTNFQEWTKFASQQSAPVTLQAGKVYWLEAQEREGSGGDSLAVSWAGPGIAQQAIPAGNLFPCVPGTNFGVPPNIVTAPTVAITSPANGAQFGSGDNIPITANVTAGSDTITSVDFYRGPTLIGSDTTAPYSVTYNNAVIAASETLTARVSFAGTYATSAPVTITVWNSDPAADADGDGFTTGLENTLGTNPYSSASQPAAIYSSLRAWWKLDESSGTVADDSTGRVQDGTVAGGATWGPGIVNGALTFDGVDDGVLVGNSASLTGTTDFTLGAWVKVNPGATSSGCVLQQREGGSGINGEYMVVVNTNGTVNFFVYNGAYQFNITSTATINDGQWHYLTAIRSGTNGLLYFDGTQVASGSGTVKSLGAFAVAIGYDYRDNTARFKGSIDDVRIYSRALSAAEIDSIAPNRAPFFTSNPVTKPAATEDAAYTGSTLAGSGADSDSGDTLTYAKVSGPAWLSVAADGTLSGTPGNANVGNNSFTVRVTDNGGLSSTGTLSITVTNTNDAPTFNTSPITGSGATEDAAYSGTLVGSASDIDAGDTLSYSKVSGPTWLTVAASGALGGTPANGDVGANAFTVRVTDAGGLFADATLNISVANTNDAPTFNTNPVAGAGATQGAAYSSTLAGTASDVDAGDTLTYSKVGGPAWLGVASNGALSGVPSNSDVGLNAFTVRVTDAAGAFADATLNISVANVNDAPTWTSGTITKPGASEGTAYSSSLATDAADIDAGDTLSFSKVGGPAWLSVASNGALSGTPTASDAGLNAFTVRVTDTGGLFADATLQITVALVNTNGTWINPAGGSWTTGTNWNGNAIAGGAGKTADFSTLDLTADATVTLDGARTIGNLVFGDTAASHNWSLATGTGGPLTLDVTTGLPAITVNNQSATVGTVLAGTEGLRKAGAGTLTLAAVNTFTGGFTVDAGLVRLQAGAYNRVIPVASAITINGGTVETVDVNGIMGNNFTVNTGGTLKFSAYHAHPNNVTLAGGAITTSGSGKYNGDDFQLDGTLTVNGSAASTITLTNGFSTKIAPTITVADVTGDASADLTISGAGSIHNPDSGTTSFTKAGAGTLVLANSNTYTGATTVSAGTLRVNGAITTSAVTVQSSATLDGTGTLGGAVAVQSGATLAPGTDGIGTLTVNNTLGLAGTTAMDVSKSGATLTADLVTGVTTLTYGGTLVVTSVGPDALAAGNSFQLFSATTYAGTFSTLTLPTLAGGLVWDTSRLAIDGTISVGSIPVAMNDSVTTPEDTPVSIPVLANDTDADIDVLAIQSVTQGAHGSVTIVGTSVTYSPATDWSGTDSFTYTATDNQDGTSTATVSVTVTAVNDAPDFTANPLTKPAATIGVAYTSNIAGDATDIDAGDTRTFSKISGPAWLTVASTGALTGTPPGGSAGVNAFTVRVTDAGGLFADATLNITVSGSLPSGWAGADIGSVGIPGGASENAGTYTVSGSGADIFGTADAFQFVSQTLTGDGEIRARVTSQSNTNAWAKAGVMIRNGTAADAANVLMSLTPGNGFAYLARTTAGGSTSSAVTSASNAAPNNWVRITRSGTVFTSYTSADGVTWTQAGTATITMASTVNVGLAVCSHNNAALSTATFDNVTITPYPAPWLSADIGTTGLVGRAEYFGSVHTVSGAGVFGGTTDGFRYVYQTLSADGSIVARVKTLQNTGTSATVGVMIRDTLANNARMGALTVTGSGGWRWQRRTTTGGSVSTTNSSSGTAPNIWVRLVRSGNSVTASRSTDGVTWTIISTVTITMASNCYIGLAVDSGSTSTLNTSALDNITVVP